MFIEYIALITHSNPYSKTNRFLHPIYIPLGPKFLYLDDATWIGQKFFGKLKKSCASGKDEEVFCPL